MTKTLRRIGIVLGSLLLLLVAAALLLESPWARAWLEDRASRELGGRDVEIGGLDIGWGVPLTVQLSEVRIANASWAEVAELAHVEELAISVDVGALLTGEVELERLDAERPEIHLARREDGTSNWHPLVEALRDEEETDEGPPLWPDTFSVEQGRLRFHDAQQAIELDVDFETPDDTVDGLRLALSGEGRIQDDPLHFQALAGFQAEAQRLTIEGLEGEIGDSRVSGSLLADLGREVPRLEARLDADELDLDRWGLFDQAAESDEAAPQDTTPLDTWDQRVVEAWELLEAYEAQLNLSVGRLRYAEQTLQDLALDAQLEEGRLEIERLHAVQESEGAERGALTVQGTLDVREQRLAADLEASVDQVDLTALLAPLGMGELGTLDGHFNTRVVEGGLLFEDTAFDYQAPQWGLTLSLQADSREIEGDSGPGVHLVGDGTYEQEPFTFDLTVGPLLDLTDDETPYPISGEVSTGDTWLQLDGSVVQPFALEALEGNFHLEGPTPAQLTELTGLNLPDLPPYRVSSHLSYRDDLLNLEGLEGGFGDSDVAGDVRLRLGEQPRYWATLTSNTLDADDLLPMLGISPGTEGAETASPEQQREAAAEQRRQELFSDRSWNLEALRGTDIVLDYSADSVQARHVPFTDVSLSLELERGVMSVEPLIVGLGGGRVEASWVMEARQQAIDGDLNLAIEQVNLKALLDDADLPDVAEDTLGVIGGRGEFSYRGGSMAEVMAGLDGTLELAMAQGWLDIIAAELLPLNVANALIAALADEEQVQLECTYVQLVSEDGLVSLDEFFMATEGAHFTGAGAINLQSEAMELAFEGHNKDPTLFTGNSPVKLEGPLRDPEVNVVTRELLARGLASVLGALVAPPAAIIPWVDPGGGEEVGMGCEQALSEFDEPE